MAIISLGTESYPLIDFDEEGVLGARTDETCPIHLETTLQPPKGVDLNDYVYGMYIRNIPTRSMLKSTNAEIDQRNQLNDLDLRIYASGFLGAPGTGKTFFFNVLGRMMHEKGAILVDCSDKDLKTLFENPTFDTQSANREKNALDAKIRLYNMGQKDSISQASLDKLKQIVGSAWHEDEGRITIDWSAIHFDGNDMADYERSVKVFQNMLKEICKAEGLDVSGSSMNIGITMEDGELFRVFDPQSPDYGRPIILDELNRAKYGTMDNLYGVLNFLNSPNMKTFKIKGANGRELTIDKSKIPQTFYLNFTGNQAIDGMGSQAFNDPFLSRIPEGFALKTIPDIKPRDMADMVCSYLMGISGTTLSEAFNVDLRNPDQLNNFVAFLREARTIGLTEEQKRAIPESQLHNIDNAAKIIPLSLQLGKFFYELKQLAQGQGDYRKIWDNIDVPPELETYLKQKTVDYRTIPHFFIKADQIKGSVARVGLPSLGKGKGSNGSGARKISKAERYATRGNRLETVVGDWLNMTFLPADMGVRRIEEEKARKIFGQAMQLAYQNGILPQKTHEAKRSMMPICELYNIEVKETGLYYSQLQTAIAAVLRRRHQDIGSDETDEELVPKHVVEGAMIELGESHGKSALKAAYSAKNLMVVNEDVDNVKAKMLVEASLINDDEVEPAVSTDSLLLSLAIDNVQKQNIQMLFQSPRVRSLSDEGKGWTDFNAEGSIKFGLLKTVNGSEQTPSYVWTFYNKETNHLLLIGDEVSSEVLDVFSKLDHRTYIDRTQTPQGKIAKLIENCVGENNMFSVECALCETYGIRTKGRFEQIMVLPASEFAPHTVENSKGAKEDVYYGEYANVIGKPEQSSGGRSSFFGRFGGRGK